MNRHSFKRLELCLACKFLGLFFLVSCNTENVPNSENGIKGKLSDNSKLTLRITDNNDSNYHWDSNTLFLNVKNLSSEVLLHELMHAYQYFNTTSNQFKSSLLNQEIEAHYAHGLYLKRIDTKKYNHFTSYRRGRAIKRLECYLNGNGTYKSGITPDGFELFLLNNTIPTFQSCDNYKNYPVDYDNLTFDNISNLAKNCAS